MLVACEDAVEDFIAIHSSDARKQLADFHIGTYNDRSGGRVIRVPVPSPKEIERGSTCEHQRCISERKDFSFLFSRPRARARFTFRPTRLCSVAKKNRRKRPRWEESERFADKGLCFLFISNRSV